MKLLNMFKKLLLTMSLVWILFTVGLSFFSCNPGSMKKTLGNDSIKKYTYQKIEEIAASIEMPVLKGDTIDFSEYAGIKPDLEGTKDFKPAFDKLMKHISEQGGGVIYFKHTKGKDEWIKATEIYRFSGPIDLESNLTLMLDPNIMLSFDFNITAYRNEGKGVITRYEGTTIYGLSPCIRAFNKKNIIISSVKGNGAMPVIFGNGEKWQEYIVGIDYDFIKKDKKPDYLMLRDVNNANTPLRDRKFANAFLRPDLIQFFMCQNVLMDGVFLKESPFWVLHPVFSENLIFRNLIFDAQVVNNDGIDVESCKNVLIENVIFNNHDDNVVIKSGRDQEGMFGVDITGTELEKINSAMINQNKLTGPTENVAVRNCVFHGHHAVCIGSEMSGGANNIFIADCVSPQFVYMGLYLKGSRKRGGEVKNIFMVDCKFNNVLNDVIGLIPNYDGDTISPYPSYFHHVYVSDIQVNNSHNYGIKIIGWPDKPIHDVYLSNIHVNEVRKSPFLIKQSENINLNNVLINGAKINERIQHLDKKTKPSKQV